MQLSVALKGVMTQQLLPTADGSGRVVACEVLVPTPAVRNLIREGKTHQIPSVMQTGVERRHADDGRRAGGLVRAGKITPAPRRAALLDARGAAPPARASAACRRPDRMASYVFKAMDLTGAKATGEVEADTKQVVADQLKARGLIVLDIKAKHGSKEISLDFMKRVKPTDLTIMTRQLATMISSGMTILRALYVLEAQTENKLLADIIADVRKDVEAGLPLSGALERHPKVFSPLFVAMTRAGETGGVLEESLLRVADQLEKEDSLRRQIKSAMVYPGVIMTFALIVLVALVTFLVPVFVGVFKQFGGDLPTITKFTVALSQRDQGPVVGLHRRLGRQCLGLPQVPPQRLGASASGTPSACAFR